LSVERSKAVLGSAAAENPKGTVYGGIIEFTSPEVGFTTHLEQA
jgi:hypothetical protein